MKCGVLIGHFSNVGNEGTIIRTAEAFGINNVFVIGTKQKEYFSAQGADRHVNFFEYPTVTDLIDYAITHNHSLVSIENTTNAIELNNVSSYPTNPIFVTGNENRGVPKEILTNSKLIIKIDQGFGYVKCLNTSVAMGIVLHNFYNSRLNTRVCQWSE
jgi:tRNA G18 (ribose-2'-O)-methylase SpoU